MKLQIALDDVKKENLLNLTEEIYDLVDIFEIGTPFLMRYGMDTIKTLKVKYPQKTILVDSKIMDGANLETRDLVNANADIITVLGLADNTTIKQVVDISHQVGRLVLADLINIHDIEKRAKELIQLNVDYIGVHTGVDVQATGRTPLNDLRRLVNRIPSNKIAVAGGINITNINLYIEQNPGIIIIGSALINSKNRRRDLTLMREKMKG